MLRIRFAFGEWHRGANIMHSGYEGRLRSGSTGDVTGYWAYGMIVALDYPSTFHILHFIMLQVALKPSWIKGDYRR